MTGRRRLNGARQRLRVEDDPDTVNPKRRRDEVLVEDGEGGVERDGDVSLLVANEGVGGGVVERVGWVIWISLRPCGAVPIGSAPMPYMCAAWPSACTR